MTPTRKCAECRQWFVPEVSSEGVARGLWIAANAARALLSKLGQATREEPIVEIDAWEEEHA